MLGARPQTLMVGGGRENIYPGQGRRVWTAPS
jgi:hypothetical protein